MSMLNFWHLNDFCSNEICHPFIQWKQSWMKTCLQWYSLSHHFYFPYFSVLLVVMLLPIFIFIFRIILFIHLFLPLSLYSLLFIFRNNNAFFFQGVINTKYIGQCILRWFLEFFSFFSPNGLHSIVKIELAFEMDFLAKILCHLTHLVSVCLFYLAVICWMTNEWKTFKKIVD